MSKMSDMTEYHASAYRLPSGFEHCSKLKPVAEAATALDRVKAVVDVLYSPGGCPWDGKQTNKSLLKNLLEETYEYVDAVETHDRDNMREELGDVLLQSVFQARVCESDTEDPFGIDEVADRLVNKLITRHPHVFAADDAGNSSDSSDAFDADSNDGGEAAQPESPEAVLALWEKMKQQEKHRKSVLEGISRAQGALPRAAKVVSRISKSPNADRLFAAFDEPAAADAVVLAENADGVVNFLFADFDLAAGGFLSLQLFVDGVLHDFVDDQQFGLPVVGDAGGHAEGAHPMVDVFGGDDVAVDLRQNADRAGIGRRFADVFGLRGTGRGFRRRGGLTEQYRLLFFPRRGGFRPDGRIAGSKLSPGFGGEHQAQGQQHFLDHK